MHVLFTLTYKQFTKLTYKIVHTDLHTDLQNCIFVEYGAYSITVC